MREKHCFDRPFEIKEVSDTGVFTGLGSVFGNLDRGDDIVQAGAFTKSVAALKTQGRMPAMLWQHNTDEPIGAYKSMQETADGLIVQGQLALKTQRGAEAYELMKMGAIGGLSIGGWVTGANYDNKNDIRTITEFELWEVSVVTFPMNDEARIAAVKSVDQIEDFKSACDYLRNACGCSRTEATAIVARLKALTLRNAAASDSAELKAIEALLRQRTELIAA